jgi:SEC-C motif
VPTVADRHAEFARQLESDLEEYPDDRGEILLEAGDAWHRAGHSHRAIALLTEAVALGGEDGGNARVALADVLFDIGRDEEARTQLGALRASRPSSPMPWHMGAELLEHRGELDQALIWFTAAVSRLGAEEMATRHQGLSYANALLAGRRRVRRRLGQPPDDLDDSVGEMGPSTTDPVGVPFTDIEWSGATYSPPDDRSRAPREVRILFWPRDEIARAHQSWPQLVQHTDSDAIARDREADNRALSAAGTPRITMVPLTVAGLNEFVDRTGGDPTEGSTRHEYMAEILAEGGVIAWPPARNALCWCGSAAKYKKCCGRSKQESRQQLGLDESAGHLEQWPT